MDIQNILKQLPTPCYVIDEAALIKNLDILSYVEKQTGCHVLLAQKAFSAYRLYPLISQYISGTTASGIFEARLAREEMGNRQRNYRAGKSACIGNSRNHDGLA